MSRRKRSRRRRIWWRIVGVRHALTRAQWMAVAVAVLLATGTGAAVTIVGRSQTSQPVPSTFSGPPLQTTGTTTTSSETAPAQPTVRLIVPTASIDIEVIPGDGVHVPLHLAMHYPGTKWPGEGGASLFYAHAQQGMFVGLFHVHPGEEIRAVRADGSQVLYRIRAIEQVPYNDDSVLSPSSFEQITLLTCTGYSPTGTRLIVIGTAV